MLHIQAESDCITLCCVGHMPDHHALNDEPLALDVFGPYKYSGISCQSFKIKSSFDEKGYKHFGHTILFAKFCASL